MLKQKTLLIGHFWSCPFSQRIFVCSSIFHSSTVTPDIRNIFSHRWILFIVIDNMSIVTQFFFWKLKDFIKTFLPTFEAWNWIRKVAYRITLLKCRYVKKNNNKNTFSASWKCFQTKFQMTAKTSSQLLFTESFSFVFYFYYAVSRHLLCCCWTLLSQMLCDTLWIAVGTKALVDALFFFNSTSKPWKRSETLWQKTLQVAVMRCKTFHFPFVSPS